MDYRERLLAHTLYSRRFLKGLLDNQLLTSESLIRRIAFAVLAILLVAFLVVLGVYQYRVSTPYVRDVLALKGDAVQGHAIFLMNCAGCHGSEATGEWGLACEKYPTASLKRALSIR